MMDQYEQEIEQLYEDQSQGLITMAELNAAVRQMERGRREDAQESAQQAYDDEMGRW